MSKESKLSAYRNNNRGIIQVIILIVIGLIILRVLGFNIADVLNNPSVKDFIIWSKEVLYNAWIDFLTIFNFVKEA